MAVQMHTSKKEEETKKEKSRCSVPILTTTTQTPRRQHLKSMLSKNDASKCTSVVVARSKILGFHPEDSTCSQNNAFNKAIARHNQLRSDLGFSP
jgi:hypothetical protein